MFDNGDLMTDLGEPESESVSGYSGTADKYFQLCHALIVVIGSRTATKLITRGGWRSTGEKRAILSEQD